MIKISSYNSSVQPEGHAAIGSVPDHNSPGFRKFPCIVETVRSISKQEAS